MRWVGNLPKGCTQDSGQSAGEPALQGNTEGVRPFLCREQKAQWGPHHSKEQLQRGQRLSAKGAKKTSKSSTRRNFISVWKKIYFTIRIIIHETTSLTTL